MKEFRNKLIVHGLMKINDKYNGGKYHDTE